MISPFTPDEIDPVSMLLRSRYLSDTTVEEIDAEVQPDPADALAASCPGLCWEARGVHFAVLETVGPRASRFRGNPHGKSITPKGYSQPIGVIDRGMGEGNKVEVLRILPFDGRRGLFAVNPGQNGDGDGHESDDPGEALGACDHGAREGLTRERP